MLVKVQFKKNVVLTSFALLVLGVSQHWEKEVLFRVDVLRESLPELVFSLLIAIT